MTTHQRISDLERKLDEDNRSRNARALRLVGEWLA